MRVASRRARSTAVTGVGRAGSRNKEPRQYEEQIHADPPPRVSFPEDGEFARTMELSNEMQWHHESDRDPAHAVERRESGGVGHAQIRPIRATHTAESAWNSPKRPDAELVTHWHGKRTSRFSSPRNESSTLILLPRTGIESGSGGETKPPLGRIVDAVGLIGQPGDRLGEPSPPTGSPTDRKRSDAKFAVWDRGWVTRLSGCRLPWSLA